MESKKNIRQHKSLNWRMKKYCRWFRRYLYRVRTTERQLGGKIDAC